MPVQTLEPQALTSCLKLQVLLALDIRVVSPRVRQMEGTQSLSPGHPKWADCMRKGRPPSFDFKCQLLNLLTSIFTRGAKELCKLALSTHRTWRAVGSKRFTRSRRRSPSQDNFKYLNFLLKKLYHVARDREGRPKILLLVHAQARSMRSRSKVSKDSET